MTTSTVDNGRYHLTRKLGRGGSAEVMLAQHRDNQTFYAMKVFKLDP